MDGIQTWSTFEKQRKAGGDSGSSGAAVATSGSKGIDALYVASSSPAIAPAAASLLRHSGLSAPASSNAGGSDNADGSQRMGEDEFRLRFHWMRPHPSLAYALEDKLGGAGIKSDDVGGEKQTQSQGDASKQIHPVFESAKLMEAYRYSQVKKLADAAKESDGNGEGGGDGDDLDPISSQKDAETGNGGNPAIASIPDLPLELPKLRINLANLAEPPLMSAWLPGEDTGISCDGDSER